MRTAPALLPLAAWLVLATCTLPALAQSQLKPGLWEYSMQMKSGDGQTEATMARAQEQLAKMPPEQRKQMEAMLAKNGVAMGAKANTVRVCLSKEAAERGEPPQNDGRCKHETLQRSGSSMKFRFSCAGEPPSSGEGEYTFAGPGSYTGHMVMTTVVKGQAKRMEMNQTGQWLSADCGGLKPITPHAPQTAPDR